MRVADSTLRNNVMRNLSRSLREMSKAQRQMASGQLINKPSDNPVVAVKLLNINSALAETAQYQANVRDAKAWVDLTDSTLDKIGEALHRARDLTLEGITGTTPQYARDHIATEVDQILEHVVSLANSSIDGDRYLFGGTHSQGKPFQVTAAGAVSSSVGAGSGVVKYEIMRGIEMQVNVEGAFTFVHGGVFDSLHDLAEALRTGGDGQTQLSAIDSAFDNLLNQRAIVGARQKRLEMTDLRYEDEIGVMTELKSTLGDVDLAEAIMNFNVKEHVYQAALAAGARVMQPTLLDYLR